MAFHDCHSCLKYSRWRSATNVKGDNRLADDGDTLPLTPIVDTRASSNCFIASCPARIRFSRYLCASADGSMLLMAASSSSWTYQSMRCRPILKRRQFETHWRADKRTPSTATVSSDLIAFAGDPRSGSGLETPCFGYQRP